MAQVKFELLGAKQLERTLAQLPKAMAKTVLRAALKKAGQPIVQDARSKAPRDTGDLADSIELKSILARRQRRGRPKKGAVEAFIGPTFPRGAHGHLVEFGTSTMPARPFLRPAWDSGRSRLFKRIGEELRKALAKAVKRHAKRVAKGL